MKVFLINLWLDLRPLKERLQEVLDECPYPPFSTASKTFLQESLHISVDD